MKKQGKFDNRAHYRPRREEAPAVRDEAVEESLVLEGRHAVREALRAGRSINKLYYADGETDGGLGQLIAEAKKAGAPIQCVDRARLDALSTTGKHQGLIAVCSAYEYADFGTLVNAAKEGNGLLVVLDNITDPHNLGAIIRTALCAGADGVIIPKHRAVGLTAAAVKASAGAVEYLSVARVTNINAALKELKKEGFWVSGAVMDGKPMYEVDFKGPTVLVIGSEGDGIRPLTREECDFEVSIPMSGPLDSLNAAVASGVLLYEIYRQRRG